MWVQSGLVVTVFGHGGLLPPLPTPSYTLVSAKRFLYDAKHGELGELAFVGLIQSLVITRGVAFDEIAMCSMLNVDVAGSVSN